MVEHPADYPWSSHRANAQGKPNALLILHEEYLALGTTAEVRMSAYRDLFRTELDPEAIQEIRDSANGGYALGDSRFKEQLQAMAGRRVVRNKVGRPAADAQPHGEGQQSLFEGGE